VLVDARRQHQAVFLGDGARKEYEYDITVIMFIEKSKFFSYRINQGGIDTIRHDLDISLTLTMAIFVNNSVTLSGRLGAKGVTAISIS
jgi:hypothetical protein